MTKLEPLRSVYHHDAVISTVLHSFISNLPQYSSSLQTHLVQENYQAAAAICHRLKGTAAGYGYPDIAATAGDIESMLINRNVKLDLLDQLVQKLIDLQKRATLAS